MRAHLCSSKMIINANGPFFFLSLSCFIEAALGSDWHRSIFSFFSLYFLWFSHKWLSKSLSIIYIPTLSKLLVFIKLNKQSNKGEERERIALNKYENKTKSNQFLDFYHIFPWWQIPWTIQKNEEKEPE